jgi:hypothetical protein
MKLYAHYVGTGKHKYLLISTDITGRDVVLRFTVDGKKEAKAKAKEHNATPWNF